MNIFIKYKNEKILIKTIKYESIHSIINKSLDLFEINFIDKNIDDYNIIYKNNILDLSYSLEKYNITENNVLILNKKLKGGNGFMTFAKEYYYIVIIVFIICLFFCKFFENFFFLTFNI